MRVLKGLPSSLTGDGRSSILDHSSPPSIAGPEAPLLIGLITCGNDFCAVTAPRSLGRSITIRSTLIQRQRVVGHARQVISSVCHSAENPLDHYSPILCTSTMHSNYISRLVQSLPSHGLPATAKLTISARHPPHRRATETSCKWQNLAPPYHIAPVTVISIIIISIVTSMHTDCNLRALPVMNLYSIFIKLPVWLVMLAPQPVNNGLRCDPLFISYPATLMYYA